MLCRGIALRLDLFNQQTALQRSPPTCLRRNSAVLTECHWKGVCGLGVKLLHPRKHSRQTVDWWLRQH
jgi:hypothetical protein